MTATQIVYRVTKSFRFNGKDFNVGDVFDDTTADPRRVKQLHEARKITLLPVSEVAPPAPKKPADTKLTPPKNTKKTTPPKTKPSAPSAIVQPATATTSKGNKISDDDITAAVSGPRRKNTTEDDQ